jgi:hypothetical protein
MNKYQNVAFSKNIARAKTASLNKLLVRGTRFCSLKVKHGRLVTAEIRLLLDQCL